VEGGKGARNWRCKTSGSITSRDNRSRSFAGLIDSMVDSIILSFCMVEVGDIVVVDSIILSFCMVEVGDIVESTTFSACCGLFFVVDSVESTI
jgi:hypothetical protein